MVTNLSPQIKHQLVFFLHHTLIKSLDAEKALNNFFKNLSKEEKQNLDQERFKDLF